MSGLFITIEGVEGAGKTTQLKRLHRYLDELGYSVIVTREPGGTPVSEAVRLLLLDPSHTGMAPVTELLLYEAARAQHVAELIRPALDAGKTVLCDRFADSTTAYQGAGRALAPDDILALHNLATGGLWPDLTLVLDLPVKTGLERARNRGRYDRLEQETLSFHERVRDGFHELARREPERIKVIDATGSVEEIAAVIRTQVGALAARKKADVSP